VASAVRDRTVVASHLHLNNSAARRTKAALNAFDITFNGRVTAGRR
jgi:hypothetical protein